MDVEGGCTRGCGGEKRLTSVWVLVGSGGEGMDGEGRTEGCVWLEWRLT